MASRPLLTACMVIRNEERLLGRCLQALRGIVDEIVILHDGECEDRSLEIARNFGAIVEVRPRSGSAEAHRPRSFALASGEWVLYIDPDEYFTEDSRPKIRPMLESGEADAYMVNIMISDGKRFVSRGPFYSGVRTTLVRKSTLKFIGITHAAPITTGRTVKRRDIRIANDPGGVDNFTWSNFWDKWLRWARVEARQIARYSEAPRFPTDIPDTDPAFGPYAFKSKHPAIACAKELFFFSAGSVRRGLLISDLFSWKIYFLQIARVIFTQYYVWREKRSNAAV